MWEVPIFEHRLDNTSGVQSLTGLSCRHRKKAERVGVEEAELVLSLEAADDGLGTREGFLGILIG